MSDDEEKGSRDNTSPDHEPKNVDNKYDAPGGHMGTDKTRPKLGLGSGFQTINVSAQVYIERQEKDTSSTSKLSPEEERAAYLDSLPKDTVFTSLTGDPEIDKESIDRGEVPVTEDEFEKLKSQAAENSRASEASPQFSQEQYESTVNKLRQHFNECSNGIDID
ncbi:hypothetical protein [Tritonibacter mobilis]|uniref:hypothetical protein n=1 Tax=Tritonibacter mobilis TaxID=379347 RepID=UPI000806A67E|nr:hypothetical protein [Tritonibacter mobilis]